jgi:hypothetical protein
VKALAIILTVLSLSAGAIGCGSESPASEACVQHNEGCQQLNDERKNTEAREREATQQHEAVREAERLRGEE